jgi:hypothetical protein
MLEVRDAERARKLGIRLREEPVHELEAAFVRYQVPAALCRLRERCELPHLEVRQVAAPLEAVAEFRELAKDGGEEVVVRGGHAILLPLSEGFAHKLQRAHGNLPATLLG